MKLSIIIVTWNSAADIDACIDSTNFGDSFELVVVDNASGDETRARLAAHHHLRLLANPANLGYARANNQGLALATGEQVLLLNPDTAIDLFALDRMSAFLDAHPEVAAVAPRLVNPDGSTQQSLRSFPTATRVLWELTGLARLFPSSRNFGGLRMRWFDYDRPQPVEQPMASCLLLRADVLNRLSGFDEQFPIFYNDVDLSRRMAELGLVTWYLPDARVTHKRGASTGQARARMVWESHRSLFRYLRKHDRSGWFWLKAVWLLPALECAAIVRVIALRLRGSRAR
jgi:GT2 family glycosyltransferase